MVAVEGVIAPESPKTQRARQKLAKKIEGQEITEGKLKKAIHEIHDQIARNAPWRVHIEKKGIALFNHNQDAAKASKKVETFAKTLIASKRNIR